MLGCIADDFTGATDLAALLARSGRPVSLRLGVPDQQPADAEIEVIALKCRTIVAADAVAQTTKALTWLQAAGAKRFFWKYCSTFDSTATGNIGPVAEKFLDQLGTAQTIYCPAFPENGRTVYMGNLFVNKVPLAESPMRNHPLTPMHDSNLVRLLQPQVTKAVGLVDHQVIVKGASAINMELEQLQAQGIAHVVVDAINNADLTAIATACAELPLVTGGSALAAQLPKLYAEQGILTQDQDDFSQPQLPQGTLILAGSCSQMTQEQVAQYRNQAPSFQLDPAEIVAEGFTKACQWLTEQDPKLNPMLYSTAAPEQVAAVQEKLGTETVSQAIEHCHAQLAATAVANGYRRFIVAGGETAGAVVNELGVTKLSIGKEIAPGVPWTFAKHQDHDIALALKSGNFGNPAFFSDAITQLP